MLPRAQQHEAARDQALKQVPSFDYAEALLQIAIGLISGAIVAGVPWLAYFGGVLGIMGIVLCLNGFLLRVNIPGLS